VVAASTAVYIGLKALLGAFARVHFYDRAGYDSSH
jgi:hypothetical protein